MTVWDRLQEIEVEVSLVLLAEAFQVSAAHRLLDHVAVRVSVCEGPDATPRQAGDHHHQYCRGKATHTHFTK